MVKDLRTPQQTFQALDILDRREITADCFEHGHFLSSGEIDCPGHNWGMKKRTSCEEEYLCEVAATFMLMPNDTGRAPDEEAALWEVEPWVVRFRRALCGGVPTPDGQGRLF